jgi:hypothetical protein
MMTRDQLLLEGEKRLSLKELSELRKIANDPSKRLSPAASAQFIGLFLQGYTCEQIAEQNSGFGLTALGLIVRARIEYDWDSKREEYTKTLIENTRQAVEKTKLESIQFAADGMAVFHKLVGNRYRRFLQTGDETELGDFRPTFKNYREFIELMESLSLKKEGNTPEVSISPTAEPAIKPESDTELKPVDAMALFKLFNTPVGDK